MPLTKDFRETVRKRVHQEPALREALLREAIELLLSEDKQSGRALLQNYFTDR